MRCAIKFKYQVSHTSTHPEQMEHTGPKGVSLWIYIQGQVCQVREPFNVFQQVLIVRNVLLQINANTQK
jgi:hypothetical protein